MGADSNKKTTKLLSNLLLTYLAMGANSTHIPSVERIRSWVNMKSVAILF